MQQKSKVTHVLFCALFVYYFWSHCLFFYCHVCVLTSVDVVRLFLRHLIYIRALKQWLRKSFMSAILVWVTQTHTHSCSACGPYAHLANLNSLTFAKKIVFDKRVEIITMIIKLFLEVAAIWQCLVDVINSLDLMMPVEILVSCFHTLPLMDLCFCHWLAAVGEIFIYISNDHIGSTLLKLLIMFRVTVIIKWELMLIDTR